MAELFEGARKLGDGGNQRVGSLGAEATVRGKGAQHADRTHAGAAGHFNVFRRIAHIKTNLRLEPQALQRQPQRRRMRLAVAGILTADAGGEEVRQAELPELPKYAQAVAAGDQAQREASRKLSDHATRAGQKRRLVPTVEALPEPVGFLPA